MRAFKAVCVVVGLFLGWYGMTEFADWNERKKAEAKALRYAQAIDEERHEAYLNCLERSKPRCYLSSCTDAPACKPQPMPKILKEYYDEKNN